MCEKKAYATLGKAQKAAKRFAKLFNGRKARAYLCDQCPHFHLTTQPLDECKQKMKKPYKRKKIQDHVVRNPYRFNHFVNTNKMVPKEKPALRRAFPFHEPWVRWTRTPT